MKLESRCKVDGNKFYVQEDGADSGKNVYYKEFAVTDAADNYEGLRQMNYLTGVFRADESAIELKKERATFVLIAEKDQEGNITEKFRFYYPGTAGKDELWIKVAKNKKFGKNAYAITIRWAQYKAEDINSQYIYLKDNRGRRYYFLTEMISAVAPESKTPEDCFIFELPEGDSIQNYSVDVDPLLKEKYDIYFEME